MNTTSQPKGFGNRDPHPFRWILLLGLLSLGSAWAQNPIYGPVLVSFEPDPPVAGSAFVMNLRSLNSCAPLLVDLHLRTVVVTADRVDVFVPAEFDFCTIPIPFDVTYAIPMDGMPAGQYEVYVYALNDPPGNNVWMYFGNLIVVPPTTPLPTAPAPQTIPATGTAWLTLMALVLGLVGAWSWRRGH